MPKTQDLFECRFCGVTYAEREPFDFHEWRCEGRRGSSAEPLAPGAGREDLIADPAIVSRRLDP